jgi:GNAT superfamily N-acetyltransferase
MRWTRDEYEIDDDRARLDMERIVGWLAGSYWARNTPEAAVRRSWERAGVVLGVYHGNELIGCARAVTDFARFAYLSDVFVLPEHRGHGLGRWLVETMIEHPEIPGVRWVLHTNDAHGLYGQFGFEPADETVMQRRKSVPLNTVPADHPDY